MPPGAPPPQFGRGAPAALAVLGRRRARRRGGHAARLARDLRDSEARREAAEAEVVRALKGDEKPAKERADREKEVIQQLRYFGGRCDHQKVNGSDCREKKTYEFTHDELVWGARMAWRNAPPVPRQNNLEEPHCV